MFKKAKNRLMITLGFVLLTGVIYMATTWQKSMAQTLEMAMKIAQSAEAALSEEVISSLHTKPDELSGHIYDEVKESLAEMVRINDTIRFAYIYTQQEGRLYFAVDSEPAGSADYSPPGQEYTEAGADYSRPFFNGQVVVTPPSTDRWGRWVSVLVPMRDQISGRTIAVLAMDYPAGQWYEDAIYQTIQAGMVVLLVLLLALANFWMSQKNQAMLLEKDLLEAIFNSVPGMMYLYDDQERLIRWNRKHEEMTGYSAAELAGHRLMDWYPDDEWSQQAVTAGVATALKKGFGDAEAELRRKDGRKLPMHFTASPLVIDGRTYFAGIGIDITERKEAAADLERSEAKHRAMVANISDVIAIIDRDGKIIYKSPNIEKMFGWRPEELVGQEAWVTVHPDDRERIQSEFAQLLLADGAVRTVGYRYHCREGSYREIELTAANLLNNPNICGVLANYQDVTQRNQREREILYLNYHDTLTGLYNRRFYEEEAHRLDQERNLPITVIMGDVNGLKLINDAFGHSQGDVFLQKAAAAIQKACRGDEIIARWGGDEFVLLLPKTTASEGEVVVRRIKESYADEAVNDIRISISFGCDTKEHPEEDILKILKNAEDNMYKNKAVENESFRGNTISTIIRTLNEKSPREEQHSKRVSEICQKIGRAMGLGETRISRLKAAGLLHDIGKIAIDEGILNKVGRLSFEEWEGIKHHPEIGYRILISDPAMIDLADCALAHHEKWDGSGYPNGLRGASIPLEARIIALADCYDAMTSRRSYQKMLGKDEALAEIIDNAGSHFDPQLARIFVEKVLGESWPAETASAEVC